MRLPVELDLDQSVLDLLEALGVDANMVSGVTLSAQYDKAGPWQTLLVDSEHLIEAFDSHHLLEHRRTVIEFRTTTYNLGSVLG